MTPEQLLQTIPPIREAVNQGIEAYQAMDAFLRKLETRTHQGEPMNVPLTQDQVDAILAHYLPIYQTLLTNIEAAGDLLGTDSFS